MDQIDKLMTSQDTPMNKKRGADGEVYQMHDYFDSNAKGSTFWIPLREFI
jgi:hypothetical protein